MKIKNQIIEFFPRIKVILKPVLFNKKDHSEEQKQLVSRMGAFQIQLCYYEKEELKMITVYDGLETGRFPSESDIIEQISLKLPRKPLHI